jgi:hypothetical protein
MQQLAFESSFLALDNDDEAVQQQMANQAFFTAPIDGQECPMLPSSMGQEEMFSGENVGVYPFLHLI